ncbi:MAG: iron-containing alcohol dehydrogenase [Oscillibacter sp.]|nr:iron-containing alcohol dehydrogenase [Oscillibacter sp.]
MNFQYHNPIRFVFGTDAINQLPEFCQDRKVLLIYGGGAIQKNGVYDRLAGTLNAVGIPFVEFGGVTAATYQTILDGIALAQREQVNAIVEIGGASVMDTGKAIAFGVVHEGLEDFIEGRTKSDGKHLFDIVVPTYPSTGSEANGVCDIMEYKGHGTELFGAWPDICLMDPTVTLSLDRQSTAYSVLVCFIQASAWFIGNHQNDIAKGFAKTVLRTLLESYKKLLADPADLRAREHVMWASCVNTMGVFRSGVDNFYPWTLFSVGYIPRVAHGVSYREALAAAYPNWLKGISQYHVGDIRMLFTEIFDIDPALEDAAVVETGCAHLRMIMQAGGIPLSLSVHGACPSLEYVSSALAPEDFGEFTLEEMHRMISACYQ